MLSREPEMRDFLESLQDHLELILHHFILLVYHRYPVYVPFLSNRET